MSGGGLLAELRAEAAAAGARIEDRFRAETRPRLVRLLEDAATIAMRRAMGEDVTTAEVAIEASLANLTLMERTELQAEARAAAMRAAGTVLRALLGALA